MRIIEGIPDLFCGFTPIKFYLMTKLSKAAVFPSMELIDF